MELDEVSTFVQVVDAGSFSGAADILGLPRSTISRRISRLESRLGVRLLERTTRSMSLTEQGHAFYEGVAPALCQIQGAGELVKDLAGEPQGTLKVTAPVDFAVALLAPILRDFTALHPRVKVHLEATARYVDLVGEGFDLAIRAGRLPDSSLIARKLMASDFWIFGSEAYLQAHGWPEDPQDLTDHPCLSFPGQGSRWFLVGEEGESRDVETREVLIANEFSFLREAVVSGMGLALLPAFWSRVPDLKRVLAPWHAKGGAIHLVTPSREYLPARTRAFQAFLTERLNEDSQVDTLG